MHRSTSLALVACLLAGVSLRAQLIVYSFGPTATPTTSATTTVPAITASSFTALAGNPGTGSGTPTYSAGSGATFYTATGWTGTSPGGNYFEFTLTPSAGYTLDVTGLNFGYRATSSGPTTFVLRSSADNFSATLASSALSADATWHGFTSSSLDLTDVGAVTLRLYAYGAASSLGSLRIDDVTVFGELTAATAVPEPGAAAAIAGGAALAVIALQARRKRNDAA